MENSKKGQLAIVIPAYKGDFIKQSIDSIANQTCTHFTLYVGDDASPFDFSEIISTNSKKINIVYKRFAYNLGEKDLVGQWNRCISMTQSEEWIWLFSDDDIMGKNCVELFYDYVDKHPAECLLHFDIQIINGKNSTIYKATKFNSHLTATEFFKQILKRKVFSTVVEYIFKREFFEKVNGFESFDLAWSSDCATWMKLAIYGGINTIEGGSVKWRISNLNISSIANDKTIVLRKIRASIEYLIWTKTFFAKNSIPDKTSNTEKIRWLLIGITYNKSLSIGEKYNLITEALQKLEIQNKRSSALLMWFVEELKVCVKNVTQNNIQSI